MDCDGFVLSRNHTEYMKIMILGRNTHAKRPVRMTSYICGGRNWYKPREAIPQHHPTCVLQFAPHDRATSPRPPRPWMATARAVCIDIHPSPLAIGLAHTSPLAIAAARRRCISWPIERSGGKVPSWTAISARVSAK
ncbi:hypothetical protein LX36DRAFT_441472 [Colletotrichum falcatum]|nr:hypothetical protein LX36DRAFT_441472 [Colletotrichum falcatum]